MLSGEILIRVRDVLAEDQALASWCTETYGQVPSIFLGMDDSNPPAREDYPVVVILGIEQERGESEREIAWRIPVGVGVVDAVIDEQESPAGSRIKTFRGALNVELLRELVEGALYRAGIAPLVSASRVSSESFYPLFVSYVEFEFRMLRSTRGKC